MDENCRDAGEAFMKIVEIDNDGIEVGPKSSLKVLIGAEMG